MLKPEQQSKTGRGRGGLWLLLFVPLVVLLWAMVGIDVSWGDYALYTGWKHGLEVYDWCDMFDIYERPIALREVSGGHFVSIFGGDYCFTVKLNWYADSFHPHGVIRH